MPFLAKNTRFLSKNSLNFAVSKSNNQRFCTRYFNHNIPTARLNVSKFSLKPHIPSNDHYLLYRWYFVDSGDFLPFWSCFVLFIAFLVRFSDVFTFFIVFFDTFIPILPFKAPIPVLFLYQFNDKHFVSQKMFHVKLFSLVMRLFYIFNSNHPHFIRILLICPLFISVLSCFSLYFTYFHSFFCPFFALFLFFPDIHAVLSNISSARHSFEQTDFMRFSSRQSQSTVL